VKPRLGEAVPGIAQRATTGWNDFQGTIMWYYVPWELMWNCAFPDKYKALEFEEYLKSHSGRAFAAKRLL